MLSQKQKDCYAAMTSAYEAYEAAEKSKELEQPDGDARMSEAYAALCATKANFDSMGGDAMPATDGMMPPPAASPEGAAADTTGAYDATSENVANGGMIPAVTPMGSATPSFASFQAIKDYFSSPEGDPAAAFNALADTTEKLVQINEALRLKDRANTNRARVQNFDATMEGLRKSGRHIPKAEILKKQRDACFESRDPDKALALLVEGYSALPAQSTPATFNHGRSMFSASDANPTKGTKKLTLSDLVGTKERLSEDDMKYAALSEAVESE